MTRAALFARKSTQDGLGEHDREKSVATQIANARAFAESQGWTVVGEYVDDATSGRASKNLVQRARMLADAAAGEFDVIVVRDLDRLSRDDEETPLILAELRFAEVTVWEYLSHSPIKTDTAMDRGMTVLKATFAAVEAEKASGRTREKKLDRAKEGKIADGRVLGYRTVGEAKKKIRVVDPEEAKLVVRIFEMYARGLGLLKITRTLNGEGVVNPTGQNRRAASKRADEWANTGIRTVLRNPIYHGVQVYGRVRNVYTGKIGDRKRTQVATGKPPIEIPRPELKIVPDALWDAVQRRLADVSAMFLKRTNGQLIGKPLAGHTSRWLLSGLLRCGVCGGNLVIATKDSKRGPSRALFVCSNLRTGRKCTNNHGVPAKALTAGVVEQIKLGVVNPLVLGQRWQEELERRKAAPEALAAERESLQADVKRLDAECRNLVVLAATGALPVDIVAEQGRHKKLALENATARLQRVDALIAASQAEPVDLAVWIKEARKPLADLVEALERDPVVGRQVLAKLLTSPITVTPTEGDGWNGWTFKATAAFGSQLRPDLDLARASVLLRCYDDGTAVDPADVDDEPLPQLVDGVLVGDTAIDTRDLLPRREEKCPRGDSNTRHAV